MSQTIIDFMCFYAGGMTGYTLGAVGNLQSEKAAGRLSPSFNPWWRATAESAAWPIILACMVIVWVKGK